MLRYKQVSSRSAQVHAASCHTIAGYIPLANDRPAGRIYCAAAPAEPAQPVHRAAVVLPAGFSVREVVSAAKPRGYIEYVAACPIHGAGKRLDRWKEVADFMRAHHGCRRARPCNELQHRLTHMHRKT